MFETLLTYPINTAGYEIM